MDKEHAHNRNEHTYPIDSLAMIRYLHYAQNVLIKLIHATLTTDQVLANTAIMLLLYASLRHQNEA